MKTNSQGYTVTALDNRNKALEKENNRLKEINADMLEALSLLVDIHNTGKVWVEFAPKLGKSVCNKIEKAIKKATE